MASNECPLSVRELEILELVATGASNAQIAQKLVISANTVKVHLRNIFAKLEVESRTEATTLAIVNGWIRVSEGGVAVSTAPAEAEGVMIGPPQPFFPPLARWQKVFFLAILLVMIAILLLPRPRLASVSRPDPFTDYQLPLSLSTARSQVSRWMGEGQMPTPRARLAVVSYLGRIYAIGGDTKTGISNVVEEFDAVENAWRHRASKPNAAANIGAAVIGGKIYVPGGYGAERKALDVLEIYDPATDSWSTGAHLPEPLFAYAIAAVHSKLYLFGGSNGQRYLDITLIYDTETNTWARGTPMTTPRGFLAAGVVNDVVYVVGGYDGLGEYSLCEAYDPAKEGSRENPWSRRAAMLARRAGLAVAVVGTNLYAIGGGWDSYLYFNERYDAVNNLWASFETPVLGQWRTLGVASVELGQESVVYAMGGWNGDYLSSNERYRPFFYVSLPSIPK